MSNLGTKAGQLISSGGLIAGNGSSRRNAVISEFGKAYGTFSGADIKVIVHYPQDPVLAKALQAAKGERERELALAEDRLMTVQSDMNPTDKLAAQEEIAGMRSDLNKIDEQIENQKNAPTSKTLMEITSLSWSIFRDKSPFRPLGSVYPKGFIRGPRSIAGSMVFTIFHEHVFSELLGLNIGAYSTGSIDFDQYLYTTILPDQLPPLDISLIFANEYGAISTMSLYGVEFFQEGGTFSIEDIYSENVIQYVARDIDPMRISDMRAIDGQGVSPAWAATASDLLKEKQIIDAVLQRRDPYI